MTFLSLIFIYLIKFNLIKAFVDLDSHWCSSCDSHITTFDQHNYEFPYSGFNYLIFTDYDKIRVSASYKPCNMGSSQPSCNCAVHVTYGSSVFYLDTCGIAADSNSLQFFYNDGSTKIPILAQCDMAYIPPGQEINDVWWNTYGNAYSMPNNDLLCARSSLQDTYMIRTNDQDNDKNIYVKVMLHENGISCIYIRPSVYSFSNSGGLCGIFNNEPNDDLFIWDKLNNINSNGQPNNGYKAITADTFAMSTFWILDRNAPPELTYKKLFKTDCPCDFKVPSTVPINQCVTLVSKCLLTTIGVPIRLQEYIHAREIRKTDENAAMERCKKFFESGRLSEAVQKHLISQEQLDLLLKFCLSDMMATGDNYWAMNQVQIGQNWALETCSKSHELCQEFKQLPAKCLFNEYPVSNDYWMTQCRKK